MNNGETNNTSLSAVADNNPAVPTMDNAPISYNATEVPRPRDDAMAAADNNTAVPTVDNGPTSNNVTDMPKDDATIAGQITTQEHHPHKRIIPTCWQSHGSRLLQKDHYLCCKSVIMQITKTMVQY